MINASWAILSHRTDVLIYLNYISEEEPVQGWFEYDLEDSKYIHLILLDSFNQKTVLKLRVNQRDMNILEKYKQIPVIEIDQDNLANSHVRQYLVENRFDD